MSNRLYQNIVHQMKDVVGRSIGIIDETGIVIACSDVGKVGEARTKVREELSYSSESVVSDGYTYRFVYSGNVRMDNIVFVQGEDAHAERMVQLLAISFGNIKSLYDDKYDKGAFVRNIILDNILPSDIYAKSNELHFANDKRRVVLVIKFANPLGFTPFDLVQSMIAGAPDDYVININEQDVVVVKEVKKDDTEEISLAQKTAEKIYASLVEKVGKGAVIGVSSVVENLKDLARAYKEARIALEVGKVFDIEKNVMSYENLGIGRLIYQLPASLCEIFLQEVFRRGALESLDQETLMTVQAFFENNLNVSETSRKLFVHRNTLVYRLEKIRKLTGLDLREFDNAVTFRVALMVKKYLTSKPTKF